MKTTADNGLERTPIVPKLGDFRKRLLRNPEENANDEPFPLPVMRAASEAGQSARSSADEETVIAQRPARSGMAAAVSQLFYQARPAGKADFDLTGEIAALEKFDASIGGTLTTLRNFRRQLMEIAGVFPSLRQFQKQLEHLSRDLAPLRILHEQTRELSESTAREVSEIVKTLGPTREMSERVAKLARSLKEANELRADFDELHRFICGAEAEQAADATEPAEPAGPDMVEQAGA